MENKSDKKRKMKLKTDYNKLYIGMHIAYTLLGFIFSNLRKKTHFVNCYAYDIAIRNNMHFY